jgi:hypothetical protein
MTSPDQHTVITPDLTATPDLLGTEAVLSRVPRSEHPTTDGRRSTHYDSLVGNCGRHDPHTKEIQSILNAIEGDIALKVSHGDTGTETFITRASNGLLEDYQYAPDCSFLDDTDHGWFRLIFRSQALYEFWLFKALEGIGNHSYEFVETPGFTPVVTTSTIGLYVTGDNDGTTWRCTQCGEMFDSSGPHTEHCWDDHETARDPRELRETCQNTRDPDDVAQQQLGAF